MKRYLVVYPRLDVSFKEGPVPVERGEVPPIRLYWTKFVESLTKHLKKMGGTVDCIEIPLWQLNVNSFDWSLYDLCFIPHHQKKSFLKSKDVSNLRYYMQSPFPEYFSIDSVGWGGSLSFLPIQIHDYDEHPIFEHLRDKFERNVSKFTQPDDDYTGRDYIFFPCQIPHDQTIQYHSDISVYDALVETISACNILNKKLVVKGHPVNPSSMSELKRLVLKSNGVEWVANYNIKSLIENCDAVVTVNSGVGLESLLALKPVYSFGKSEYKQLSSGMDLVEWLESEKSVDMNFTMDYIESLMSNYAHCSDVSNVELW